MAENDKKESAPKRMSLNKKTHSTLTLHGNTGKSKVVQVEVRKRKVIDQNEIAARKAREAEEKRKQEEEQRAREEAARGASRARRA